MSNDHAALVARLTDSLRSGLLFDNLAQLREMWKDGFDTCRSYTDNWYHCEGEQRERRILAALARVKGQR
jgi:hypothetical protein